VSGDREDHLGIGDVAFGAGPVAGGLDGHEDGLGAAAGHVAGRVGQAEEGGGHADDFGFELLQALKGAGAEAVREDGGAVGVTEDLGDVFAGKVDEAPDLATAPVCVSGEGVCDLGVKVAWDFLSKGSCMGASGNVVGIR
jgi:hypothetical protein